MKFVIGFFVPVIFLTLLAFQIGAVNVQSVKAQEAPVTSPITSPVSYFRMYGIVNYISSGSAIPAHGVRITAEGTPSGKVYRTTTNSLGHYSLTVPQGTYIVRASDNQGTLFNPLYRIVDIVNKNIFGINFKGTLQ